MHKVSAIVTPKQILRSVVEYMKNTRNSSRGELVRNKNIVKQHFIGEAEMKIMSFNSRGLAGPVKKTTFIRMLTLEHPDVILLQETLGVGDVIKERLELWLPGGIL